MHHIYPITHHAQAVAHKGAVLIGPPVLREYLINYARPLVYSTALPLTSLAAIRHAMRFVRAADKERAHVFGMFLSLCVYGDDLYQDVLKA